MTSTATTGKVKICKMCPEWVGPSNSDLCVDCKRKSKIKPKLPCQFPGCKETFISKGSSRYCVEHKSMTSNERREAIRKAETENSSVPTP